MKKRILISMYSLNIGGAERSLIGLLGCLAPAGYAVDLFLYRHEGEFLSLIPQAVTLLPPIAAYTTFERPIKTILREGHLYLTLARLLAKAVVRIKSKRTGNGDATYRIMQYTWRYSLPALPVLPGKYDLAVSFLGPHDFVIHKVKADIKAGWNHTDYFTAVNPDRKLDSRMWRRLDHIVSVSEDCRDSFLKVFPTLRDKCEVIENILSPGFVRQQAEADVKAEMPDDGAVKICSVGRLSHLKGFDLAVRACEQLVKSGYAVKWYVVGYGADEGRIKALVGQCGLEDHFILLGKKTNPYPYVRECDIYCQPSRCEGKAVTVREAQILGRPVVITDFPTAKSQLAHGVDGYICPLSAEGLAEGIGKLLEDDGLRGRLIAGTRQREYGNEKEIEKINQWFLPAEGKGGRT